jgi:hypothetical protein
MASVVAGCTGLVVGRAGPGRGAITLTDRHEYYAQGSSGATVFRDDAVGTTASTFVFAGLAGPAKSATTATARSTGFGLDAFGEYLYNTPSFFGFGVRGGWAYMGSDKASDISYSGFPILLEAAIGTRVPGPVDSERSLIGSWSGLALSLHGGIGYVVGGAIHHGTATADVGGYRGNLGLRLTLPITIVQFTLTAEASYTKSNSVALEGADTRFQSTSLLFGNLVAF